MAGGVVSFIEAEGVRVYHGDCIEVMRSFADHSVDSVVTDPPYLIDFMGKGWDSADGIAGKPEVWREALRVLKPGGHLLAFGGTRTWHRLAVAIEDAGFEVRDSMAWMYGSGFPKSLDVSKAIDKSDAKDEQQQRRFKFTAWVQSQGVTAKQIDEATGTFMGNHYTTHPTQPAVMTREHLEQCRHLFADVPRWVELECDKRSVESKNFASREVVGQQPYTNPVNHINASGFADGPKGRVTLDITAPATPAAQKWAGFGTALKPAHEPIVVARKPLIGTVAENVLTHGTGALNIDGCRISEMKRWPANVALDESQADQLDEQTSRFFYVAKAGKRERPNVDGVAHPTVKPIALMRYLVRLVTPPGGTVLEPFAGSGTTVEACILEGFDCIAIEMTDDYLPLIAERVRRASEDKEGRLL
jgi:site-specific DNA-methyltransferase (adenine-specific)